MDRYRRPGIPRRGLRIGNLRLRIKMLNAERRPTTRRQEFMPIEVSEGTAANGMDLPGRRLRVLAQVVSFLEPSPTRRRTCRYGLR